MLKKRKILAVVLAASMMFSSLGMTATAQETADPIAETPSEKPVATEFTEVIDFEDGTAGFSSTDSKVDVSTTLDFQQSGEHALKITPNTLTKTYAVTKTFDDFQVGKKVSAWIYNDDASGRTIVMLLDNGEKTYYEDGYTDNAYAMFNGMFSGNERFRAFTQALDSKGVYQYIRDENNKVIEFTMDTNQISKGWHEIEIDCTVAGEVSFYANDKLMGQVDLPDGVYADFKTISFKNSWGGNATGSVYVDNISITGVAQAPSNPVVDDKKDTFDWTYSSGSAIPELYEYSLDAGETWETVTEKPLYVGNENIAIGDVQVRMKAPDLADYVLPAVSNDEAYTFTTLLDLTMESESDFNGFNSLQNIPIQASDPWTLPPEMTLSTVYSRSGLSSMKLVADDTSSVDPIIYRDLLRVGNQYDELVQDKVITVWMYDQFDAYYSSSSYKMMLSVKDDTNSDSIRETFVGFNNAVSKSTYQIRTKSSNENDSQTWSKWNDTGIARTEGWHCFQVDFTQEEGMAYVLLDGQKVGEYEAEGFNQYYLQDTWSHSTNTNFSHYFDDIYVTDSIDDVPVLPDAPTNPVNDDDANTFSFTPVAGYDSIDSYEYSTDAGKTFTTATENPINVGDETLDVGDVIVRVKASAAGNEDMQPGIVLRNDVKFVSSYAESYDGLQDTIAFVEGFFKADYSDATKWATFETALANANAITTESSKEDTLAAITALNDAVADLETCFDVPDSVRYDFEENEADENPFVGQLGILTKGEAVSAFGETITEYYADKHGAELKTEYVNGSYSSKAVYTFAQPVEDYIVDIAFEVPYPPTGSNDILLLDAEGLNGVGLRARYGSSFYQLLTVKNGQVIETNAEIRLSTNCTNQLRFDFANPESGVTVSIDGRPLVHMVNGTAVYTGNVAVDSFQQIVMRTTGSSADLDFVFDKVELIKKNPAASINIVDESVDIGYFETYNLATVLLEIVGEDPSYPTTDIIEREAISGAEFVNVTPDGVVEPMEYGTAVVEVSSSSGASDTITVNCVDAKVQEIMLTDAPLFDIIAEGEPGQDTNNSMPVTQLTETNLNLGESVVVNAKLNPSNATARLVEWTSSNENVAVVVDGLVTGVNYGEAIITATSMDGTNVTASFKVTVAEDNNSTYGKEIFVAVDGDDVTGDGTKENPYATIEMARDVIASEALPEGGVIVYFREGNYPISQSIEFDETHSGTADKPIKYTAYNNEEVTFNGAVSIPMSDMELVDEANSEFYRIHDDAVGKVYVAEISSLGIEGKNLQVVGHSAEGVQFTGLFDSMNFSESYFTVNLNDEPMTLSRFPNKDETILSSAGAGFIKTTSVPYKGSAPRNWATDAILGGWGDPYEPGDENDNFKIKSTYITADQLASWQSGIDEDLDRNDAGGQGAWMDGYWGTDYSNQTVPIAEINGDTITAGLLSQYSLGQFNAGFIKFYVYNLLEELDIPGEWYIDQITDENSFKLYFYPPEGTDMTSETDLVNIPNLNEVMINIDGASHITFDGIDMKNANAGIFNVTGGDYNSVENAEIKHIGGDLSTIKNSEDGDIPKHNGFNMCEIEFIDGGVQLAGGNDMTLERGYNYVKNSTFTTFSMQNRSYNPAVDISGVGNIVSNCVFTDAPHNAIMYGVGGSGGAEALMEFLEIYNVIHEADDQGAIYTGRDTLHRGSIIRNCYIHDVSSDHVGDKNTAIYLDDSKGGVLILDCVLENSTLGIKSGGRNVEMIGNIIVNQESGIVVDPSGYISTGYTYQHGTGLITNSSDYEDVTLEPWQDPDSAYGRFDMQWATYEDSPLNTNKYKKIIDNQFINIERVEDPRDTDHYYGVDIWSSYWEQLPFEYMMEEFTYGEIFTKNNNGYDRPEDGLAANPPVTDPSYYAVHDITVNVGEGMGKVTGDRDNLVKNVTQKITATPASGYEFVSWTDASGSVVSFNPIYIYTVDSSETFTANFAIDSEVQTYDVTVTGGTGTGSYEEGTIVNITADAPAEGMQFDKWTGDVTFADAESMTTSFEMPASGVSITATYKEIPVVEDDAVIVVSQERARVGDEVIVDITLENNPGLTSMKLLVDFDETVLKLKEVKFNSEFGSLVSSQETADDELILNWIDGTKDITTADLTYATLTFEVLDTAVVDTDYDVTVEYSVEDTFNMAGTNVAFDVENGMVTVVDVVLGDVDSDGTISNKDVFVLLQYVSDPNINIEEFASDINGDGFINNADVLALFMMVSQTV